MQRIAILVVAAALMLPAAAFAQSSSTCQAYNRELCSSVNSSDTTSTTNSASTLPFTGLDVVLLAAGGGTLVGAGFVVRRLSRRLD
jgi:hypothetical protein